MKSLKNNLNIYILPEEKFDLQLITAKVNASSVTSYIDDLLSNMALTIMHSGDIPNIPININVKKEGKVPVAYRTVSQSSYIHRIEAVKRMTSLHNWQASILGWMADEHRKNGRVWFDDTPVGLLPIRKRRS